VLGQADLIGVFDFLPFLLEFLVVDESLEFIQLGQVGQEFVTAEFGCDELGKAGVGLVQPSSRSDAVGDVGEFVGAID